VINLSVSSLFQKFSTEKLSFIKKIEPWVRNSIQSFDKLQERVWEIYTFYTHRLPSDGLMTARLIRMGVSSFKLYVLGQMQGYYGRRNFLPVDRENIVVEIKTHFPEQETMIVKIADQLCRGEFNIFSSGATDMRRGNQSWQLDWQRDPITQHRYSRLFSHWRWDVFKMRPGNADVKGPWELTRCQHFMTLGQAYWLTKDEKYAECFAKTIQDFIQKNPPGFGVHWSCTMDVALRIVGWLSGLTFFQGSSFLSYSWWKVFLKSLVQHGNFIVANLEYGTFHGKLIVSNHGVSDFLGLYWLALNFPHLDAACVWRGIAETALEQQIQLQILSDGGDYESSTPYHRLVVEMFLSAYALSLQAGLPLSDAYRDKLLSTLRFITVLRQKNGRMPQIGDADDGRAHIFTGYGLDATENMDHLLVAGATVLNCPDIAQTVLKEAWVEKLFWATQYSKPLEIKPIEPVTLLPEFGVSVIRQNETYLLMSNSVVGTRGVGNHKHNDQLAIEWIIDNQPFFVDGGSYIYTQDPDARNRFRSTRTHNTVMVNEQEQHTVNPAWLFRLEQNGEVEFGKPLITDVGVGIEGGHSAYGRLSPSLLHKRRVLVLSTGTFILQDLFEGSEQHALRWYFLLYPGVKVRIEANNANVAILEGPLGKARFEAEQVKWTVEEGWYSPGYNKRHKTLALVGLIAESQRTEKEFFFIGQSSLDVEQDIESAILIANKFWSSACQ